MSDFKLHVDETNDGEWQAFAATQSPVNIFHHPAWSQLLKECYGYRPIVLSLRDINGTIHAALPMMEINRPLQKRRWISLPFSDHCAPLSSNAIALAQLTDLIKRLTTDQRSPSIEVRWDICGGNLPPDYVLHALALNPNFEKVVGGIHHSHLRNVRAAQSNGIQIRHGVGQEELSTFYDLHLQTRRRKGVPIQPIHYFNMLNESILQKGLGFISLAYHGDKCLAGAVFLHWKETLTYKYGASSVSGQPLRPNHLIFWDAIQWGCQNGYTILDFGRTDCENTGLRAFKSRWGAREFPLRYSNFPSPKEKNIQMGLLTTMINTLIQKTPAWTGRLIGEIYYRYLG